MSDYPLANNVICAQITVPASGSAATIASLIPGSANTAIGSRKILEVRLRPVGTACELRSSAIDSGIAIPADTDTSIPSLNATGMYIVSSTAGTVTCGIAVFVY